MPGGWKPNGIFLLQASVRVDGAVKLVVEVLNRTPNKDAFCFERIDNGLRRAGAYRLEYVMLPDLPGRGPLTLTTEITVVPGPLAQIHVQVCLNPRTDHEPQLA